MNEKRFFDLELLLKEIVLIKSTIGKPSQKSNDSWTKQQQSNSSQQQQQQIQQQSCAINAQQQQQSSQNQLAQQSANPVLSFGLANSPYYLVETSIVTPQVLDFSTQNHCQIEISPSPQLQNLCNGTYMLYLIISEIPETVNVPDPIIKSAFPESAQIYVNNTLISQDVCILLLIFNPSPAAILEGQKESTDGYHPLHKPFPK